jgi:hypothetical protein
LKGSVGNFGRSPAFDMAREIEMAARQGRLDAGWKMYAALEDQIASLLPRLQAAIGEPERRRRAGRSRRVIRRKAQ